MVVEYIRYAIPSERSEEFQAGYARAQSALAASSHCLGWELSRGVEEPGNLQTQHYRVTGITGGPS